MTFHVIQDGVSIFAELHHLSKTDISAIITTPFELNGICVSGSHIPYFALCKNTYLNNGHITPKGVETIEFCLKRVWANYKIIQANIKPILKIFYKIKISYYIQHLHTDMLSDVDFKKEKQNLKKQLKTGVIDTKVYQNELSKLRKQNSIYFHMNDHIRRSFIIYLEKNFSIYGSFFTIFKKILDSIS